MVEGCADEKNGKKDGTAHAGVIAIKSEDDFIVGTDRNHVILHSEMTGLVIVAIKRMWKVSGLGEVRVRKLKLHWTFDEIFGRHDLYTASRETRSLH